MECERNPGMRSAVLMLPRITLRLCVMTKDESLSCCIKDEGWPLGFGNQILESNYPMRPLLRVQVVSDREKGRINLSCVF